MNEKDLINKLSVYVVENIDKLPPICIDDNELKFVWDKLSRFDEKLVCMENKIW